MRKIVTFMLLLCSLTVFAQGIKSSYGGELNITVNSNADKIPNQVVTAVDNGNGMVTLTIPNFTYAGITGTVTITATRDGNGNLSNPIVYFGDIEISFADFSAPSYVNGTTCVIHLEIWAVLDTVIVDYVGY